MGAFDYTTNGVTMPAHSCMTAWWGPKCYNKYIIQNKNEYYDESTK